MIDTALLIAGALTAGMYFTADSRGRNRAARARRCALPPHRLALGAERRRDDQPRLEARMRIPALRLGGLQRGASCCTCSRWARRRTRSTDDCYTAWTATYQWENLYGYDFLYAGPLFVHQFSHAWIDFRGIQDRFMREKRCDYFENSRRATQVQREYARRNPHGFAGYDENCWGLTACDGPSDELPGAGQRAAQRLFGYAARGVPYGPDDGTLAGWAALASLPFAPEIALCAARSMLATLSRDAVRTIATRAASIRASPAPTGAPGSRRATSGSTRASW